MPLVASSVSKAPINYGSSAGFAAARVAVMTDYRRPNGVDALEKVGDEGKALSRERFSWWPVTKNLQEIEKRVREALDAGAIGIGLTTGLCQRGREGSRSSNMLFALAAEYDAPLFIHVRRGLAGDPAGLDEAIAMAGKHGTRTLICHMSHSAIQNTGLFLEKVRLAVAKASISGRKCCPIMLGPFLSAQQLSSVTGRKSSTSIMAISSSLRLVNGSRKRALKRPSAKTRRRISSTTI